MRWIEKASLYEVLSLAFLYTSETTVTALVGGEYSEALLEAVRVNGFGREAIDEAVRGLDSYVGKDQTGLLHGLRTEYTRLFIGAPKPAVSPYAGVWYAEGIGVQPLVFVNKESMYVERFFAKCGIGRPVDTNEPLDHIGTELEFLNYLSLVMAGVVEPTNGENLPENTYDGFYSEHFIGWSKHFAASVLKETAEPFFRAAATVLKALPDRPL